MNRWDNLKYKYTQLSIAEKIIVINVINIGVLSLSHIPVKLLKR